MSWLILELRNDQPLLFYCRVVEHADKNEMTLSNVATVVCNTLIFYSQSSGRDSSALVSPSTDIICDLISSYAWLFDVSREELDKERKILDALDKLQKSNVYLRNGPAGDILVGVHVYDLTEGNYITSGWRAAFYDN